MVDVNNNRGRNEGQGNMIWHHSGIAPIVVRVVSCNEYTHATKKTIDINSLPFYSLSNTCDQFSKCATAGCTERRRLSHSLVEDKTRFHAPAKSMVGSSPVQQLYHICTWYLLITYWYLVSVRSVKIKHNTSLV